MVSLSGDAAVEGEHKLGAVEKEALDLAVGMLKSLPFNFLSSVGVRKTLLLCFVSHHTEMSVFLIILKRDIPGCLTALERERFQLVWILLELWRAHRYGYKKCSDVKQCSEG